MEIVRKVHGKSKGKKDCIRIEQRDKFRFSKVECKESIPKPNLVIADLWELLVSGVFLMVIWVYRGVSKRLKGI